ncbi:unnamed protein product [Lampetra fluviatilis]
MAPVGNEGDSLASSRSRRDKKDTAGRSAALEKLRKAKAGEKVSYEVEDVTRVYDEVTEEEYSNRVRDRQDDDWIVDDDGIGYVEDGREVFDDELTEDVLESRNKDRKGAGSSRKTAGGEAKKPVTKSSNIKSMFMASGGKKTLEKDVDLSKDDLLGDILQDLQSETMAATPPLPKKKPTSSAPLNPFSLKSLPKRPSAAVAATTTPKSGRGPGLTLKPGTSQATSQKHPKQEAPSRKPSKQKVAVSQEAAGQEDGEGNGAELEEGGERASESRAQAEAVADFDDADFLEAMDEEGPAVDSAVEAKVKKEQSSTSRLTMTVAPPPPPPGLGWDDEGAEVLVTEEVVTLEEGSLPLHRTDGAGGDVLRFYWIDAHEDPFAQPGVVYLFGKVLLEDTRSYVSCCVTVQNIERCLYLLPRDKRVDVKTGLAVDDAPISMKDVYEEFNSLADKFRIMKFKIRKVEKCYAFENKDVPVQSEYLEVKYLAQYPAVPADLCGQTFSRVFGSSTSSLERLLVTRGVHGPCWLHVASPQLIARPVSWCRVECLCPRPDLLSAVKDVPPPPLVVMALSMKTLPNHRTHQNEVMSVGVLVHQAFPVDKAPPRPPFQSYFSAICKPGDCIFPFNLQDVLKKQSMKMEVFPTERTLLGFLLAKIHVTDPDVLVGHDIVGFDLEVLMQRIAALKVPHWSKLSRLRRSAMPRLGGRRVVERLATCGRVVCDVKTSARELVRCRSYDLDELVASLLRTKRETFPAESVVAAYANSQRLLDMASHTLTDARHALSIMSELNALPLAHQITCIAGNLLSRTLLGGRSERNEFLLLHAFHQRNFICPDKTYSRRNSAAAEDEDEDGERGRGKRKAAYAGGLVLEPKVGFYDKFILLLDFNSLYPSIIQEYNICFTTVCQHTPPGQVTCVQGADWIPDLPDSGLELGVLPTEIRKLVERRKQVKGLMKQADLNPDLYTQYDIRQKALKLTANSMYGCLGFSLSRFYAKPLAALVTLKGREILLHTKELVQKMNLEVIYGDTDSIMINTNSRDLDEVYRLGSKVKAEVNRSYRLLEIDVDGVYRSMLLLKKKKYAALSVERQPDGSYTTRQELKGLDIVRRDWCGLAKACGNYVIGQILSDQSHGDILDKIQSHLEETGRSVADGTVDIQQYHIHKALTKDPQDYPDKRSLPHVHVALWVNSQAGKRLRAGDTVTYVVCQDGSGLAASQRAYAPEQLQRQESLRLDTEYYLASQVLPVVSRLCEPMEGVDMQIIAQWLGLDPSQFRASSSLSAVTSSSRDEDEALLGGVALSDEERFAHCERPAVTCAACGAAGTIDGPFRGSGVHIQPSLLCCTSCEASLLLNLPALSNRLQLDVRRHVGRYHAGWLLCEDVACRHRTRRLPLTFTQQGPLCPTCHRGVLRAEYTEKMLYTQLCFYQHLFDLDCKSLTEVEKNTAPPSCPGRQRSPV